MVELLVHVISLPCEVGRACDLNGPTISVREAVYGVGIYTQLRELRELPRSWADCRPTPIWLTGAGPEYPRACSVEDRQSASRAAGPGGQTVVAAGASAAREPAGFGRSWDSLNACPTFDVPGAGRRKPVLGKQTLCQLSYSRSGARDAQADRHSSEGLAGDQRSDHVHGGRRPAHAILSDRWPAAIALVVVNSITMPGS